MKENLLYSSGVLDSVHYGRFETMKKVDIQNKDLYDANQEDNETLAALVKESSPYNNNSSKQTITLHEQAIDINFNFRRSSGPNMNSTLGPTPHFSSHTGNR